MENRKTTVLEFMFQLLIITTGMGLLGGGLCMCFRGDASDVIAMTYTSGLMCFVFAYLPLFQKFKGMGVEAEMKEGNDKGDSA